MKKTIFDTKLYKECVSAKDSLEALFDDIEERAPQDDIEHLNELIDKIDDTLRTLENIDYCKGYGLEELENGIRSYLN